MSIYVYLPSILTESLADIFFSLSQMWNQTPGRTLVGFLLLLEQRREEEEKKTVEVNQVSCFVFAHNESIQMHVFHYVQKQEHET